jgi:hypothetical protein
MIENLLRIALDPVYPPCTDFPRTMSCYVPENIIMSNKFCVIFDDCYDRDRRWEEKFGGVTQNHLYDGEE